MAPGIDTHLGLPLTQMVTASGNGLPRAVPSLQGLYRACLALV